MDTISTKQNCPLTSDAQYFHIAFCIINVFLLTPFGFFPFPKRSCLHFFNKRTSRSCIERRVAAQWKIVYAFSLVSTLEVEGGEFYVRVFGDKSCSWRKVSELGFRRCNRRTSSGVRVPQRGLQWHHITLFFTQKLMKLKKYVITQYIAF